MTTKKPFFPISPRDFLDFVAAVLVAFLPALAGVWFRPDGWYRRLRKPAWNPPDALFGPVWTTLFTLNGVALWRFRRDTPSASRKARRAGLAWFGAQSVLNAGWSALFFGLRRPGWALVEVLALFAAVAGNARGFGLRSRVAGALLLPYLAWVGFAAVLNAAIWRRNRR